jgi:hypothetical protein
MARPKSPEVTVRPSNEQRMSVKAFYKSISRRLEEKGLTAGYRRYVCFPGPNNVVCRRPFHLHRLCNKRRAGANAGHTHRSQLRIDKFTPFLPDNFRRLIKSRQGVGSGLLLRSSKVLSDRVPSRETFPRRSFP